MMRKGMALATGCALVAAACSGGSPSSTLGRDLVTTTSSMAATTTATAEPSSAVNAAAPTASSTTPPAESTTISSTTTTTQLPPPFVLSRDGLEPVAYLGGTAETVISAVIRILGAPDEDSDWVEGLHAGCPPPETRMVRWAGLFLYFSTGRTHYWDEGNPHFFSYSVSAHSGEGGLVLVTSEGVGPGSTVNELRRAYPTVEFFETHAEDTGWGVPNDGRELFFEYPWFGGGATGSGASDTVNWLTAGYPCGE